MKVEIADIVIRYYGLLRSDHEQTADSLALYAELLSDQKPEMVGCAFARIAKRSPFYPMPSDILAEIAEIKKEEREAEKREALKRAVDELRKRGEI